MLDSCRPAAWGGGEHAASRRRTCCASWGRSRVARLGRPSSPGSSVSARRNPVWPGHRPIRAARSTRTLPPGPSTRARRRHGGGAERFTEHIVCSSRVARTIHFASRRHFHRYHPAAARTVSLSWEPVAGLAAVQSVSAFLSFEHQCGALAKRFPMVILCAYDVREFDGQTIIECLKLHHDTFAYELSYFLS